MSSRIKKERQPLVSCLCVTKNSIEHLLRAVQCFYDQTYRNKELVIVYEGESNEIERLFHKNQIARVTLVEVQQDLSLGELRNIAISKATGEYFCQWDDDDWYHCDRLKIQMTQLLKYYQTASVLDYFIIFDNPKKEAYLSRSRIWEGSILCKRNVFPKVRYEPWSKSEDANFIYQLLRKHEKIVPISTPGLYIYVYHGNNTWNNDYFQKLFSNSQKLTTKASRLVSDILLGKYANREASRILESNVLVKELNFLHGSLDRMADVTK